MDCENPGLAGSFVRARTYRWFPAPASAAAPFGANAQRRGGDPPPRPIQPIGTEVHGDVAPHWRDVRILPGGGEVDPSVEAGGRDVEWLLVELGALRSCPCSTCSHGDQLAAFVVTVRTTTFDSGGLPVSLMPKSSS